MWIFLLLNAIIGLFALTFAIVFGIGTQTEKMDRDQIAKAKLLDIIFDGKNKDYGAYDLRGSYHTRLLRATLIVVGGVVAIWVICLLTDNDWLPVKKEAKVQNVNLKQYHIPPVSEHTETKNIVKHRQKNISVPVKTQHYIALQIVLDRPLHLPQPRMSIDSLMNAISPPDDEGIKEDLVLKSRDEEEKDKITPLGKKKEEDLKTASMQVQRVPQYLHGKQAWEIFLKKNIRMQIPLQNGAMPGPYLVTVAFIVHTDSTVSDIQVIRDPGYGMGAEAMRVIKLGGKWIPGMKGDKVVTFAQMQDVLFRVNE